MRHRKSGRKLNRTSAHRKALMRNMVTSLLDHERIETTDAKAKELRGFADRMITLGKRGDLHARRRALRFIKSKEAMHNLFGDLAERYQDRAGGYTRIIKTGFRHGDGAPMALIQLVGAENDPFRTEAAPARRRTTRSAAPKAGATPKKAAATTRRRAPAAAKDAAESPAPRRRTRRAAASEGPKPEGE